MRLDKYLSEGAFSSRTKAVRAIERRLVLLNGKEAKPSDEVKEGDVVTFVEPAERYVSEGGFKLAKALTAFSCDVSGKTFADIGASTGGFTDVLLQRGAKHVFAVDVGESQLDESLASDMRVTVMDQTNARTLTRDSFSMPLDGVAADVSFISLTYILPVIAELLDEGGVAFALVKPQFECGARALDKHGIVKDKKMRKGAIEKIYDCARLLNLAPQDICLAPERERKNKEFVIYLKKGARDCPKERILNIEEK